MMHKPRCVIADLVYHWEKIWLESMQQFWLLRCCRLDLWITHYASDCENMSPRNRSSLYITYRNATPSWSKEIDDEVILMFGCVFW